MVDRQSLKEKRKGKENRTQVKGNTPTPTTMELENIQPSNLYPRTKPLRPVPRKQYFKKVTAFEATNPENALEQEAEEETDEEEEEDEEEENEVEVEEISEIENGIRKGREKEAFIKEMKSMEFPHLGIPYAWQPEIIQEERGEPAFHTNLVPVLALACAGPSHQFVIPQYLANILDSGMNPKAALEAPTFLAPSGMSFQQDIQVEKYVIDENILKKVDEFGQPFTEVDSQTAEDVGGFGAAVSLDNDWKMFGCVHPTKEGLAEGVSVLGSPR